MSLITTIIDGLKPNPSSGLGGANEGYIQGFQDDLTDGIVGGVADKAGGQCLVTENSPLGMSVLVANGVVYVPNIDYIANLASTTKYYRVVIKDEDPVVIPSNSSGSDCQHGLDVVIDKDTVPNEYASNVATLVLTLGTPGAGAPAVPDNAYRIAEVEVVDSATQIANVSIIDTRSQIAINDDILPSTTVYTTKTQTLTNKTLTSPVLTTPKITTSINDANGNEVIKTPATTSAVNEVTVTNAAAGNSPSISATGGDDNLDLLLVAKGTGVVKAGGVAVSTAVKASGAEITTGADDAKFTTAKALADAGVNTRLKTKVIQITRDLSTAGGDVSYTGVGFKPSALFVMASMNANQVSWGVSDSTGTDFVQARIASGAFATASGTLGSPIVFYEVSSGNYQTATVKTYDADGFTLTWARTGSPTGTLTCTVLCFI